MFRIVRNMRINFRQHGAIRMPHNASHSQMVMPLNQLPGCETMTSRIAEQAFTKCLGKAVEAVANSKLSPCLTTGISENLSVSPERRQPLHNLQRLPLQIDNTLAALALGFFSRENYALIIKLDMTGF